MRRESTLMFIAPLAAGLLTLVSFPPYKLYVTPFFCLVPLLYFIDRAPTYKRAAAGTMMYGMVFLLGLLYWISIFTKIGFVLTALIMSGVMALAAVAALHIRARLGVPLVVGFPMVWTAASYLHAHGDIAFPWGQLSHSLTYTPVWLQIASVTGPYGVTFWLAAVNVMIYNLLRRGEHLSRRRRNAVLLAVMLAAPLAFGLVRYSLHDSIEDSAPELRVAFVQPSIAQEIKWDPEMRDSTFAILRNLSIGQKEHAPQLVVWPEAATPAHIRFERNYQRFVGRVAQELNAYLLTGSPEYRYDSLAAKYRSYNSAFSFSPEGYLQQSYDKIHLVPVSERFPYEDIFTFLQDIDVGGSHFVPGETYTVFEMEREDEQFGVLVCFESIFPELSRRFVARGARFLVNITNDAWFERSAAAYQHSSFLVMRAIEEGRDIVRAANTGVSAFYDRLGRRRGATKLFERTAATDTIHTYGYRTIYNRLGDWPAHICWIGTLVLLGLSWGRKDKTGGN